MNKKLIVTCGLGGVGKTTLSASLAIQGAMQGLRSLVITIDPAKRLATSLGLIQLPDYPTNLTDALNEAAQKLGRGKIKGEFHAFIPNTKLSFENFIESLAPTPEQRRKILNNPIVKILGKEYSGANDYMALAQLEALERDPRFDLIVLDTPPSRNTIDFLDAPLLISKFFDEPLVKLLLLPTQKIVSASLKKVLQALEFLTGGHFVTHLIEFVTLLLEVQKPFNERLSRVSKILKSDNLSFLIVASGTTSALNELLALANLIRAKSFQLGGIILNRSLGHLTSEPGDEPKVALLIEEIQKRENHVITELTQNGLKPKSIIPELARDVHTLADLMLIAEKMS